MMLNEQHTLLQQASMASACMTALQSVYKAHNTGDTISHSLYNHLIIQH
jgi:hypothetical protein